MIDETLLKEIAGMLPSDDKSLNSRESRFNIFRLLQLESYETRLHSVFLAELLNPKGMHGFGSSLLEMFIQQLGISFNTQNVNVSIEKHIGTLNKDQSEGGRIDICVSNDRQQGIVIENKIYAIDQQNQLLRYYRYGKNHFTEFHLLYLTLGGHEPGSGSKGNQDEAIRYHCISYRHHILNCWRLAGRK